MDSKKIRIVVTALVPKSQSYRGRSGGMVRLVEILKRSSNIEAIKIKLVSSDERYEQVFRNGGIEFEFISVKSKLKFKSLYGLFFKSLLILVKSFFVMKLDFLESRNEKVVAYTSSDLFWEVIPAYFFKKRNKNIQWIQVIHHIYPNWKNRSGGKVANFLGYYLQRFSFRLIRKKADKIIILNNIVKKELVRMGFYGNKIFTSSNGIDIDYFDYIKKADPVYDGLFLGRLSPSKGIVDLVEIWKNICQEIPEAKLAIIGGVSEKTKDFLQKKIDGLNLKNNIDLLGYLEDSKAYSILKSGKLFIFPSHEEGWGIAIAEAMACALPVVSWDLPVYKEIFEKYTVQVKENDANLFSERVLELLKNDEMRKKIGESGKEFIRKYSWDSVAEKELEIISS